jgi:hypothetical protein
LKLEDLKLKWVRELIKMKCYKTGRFFESSSNSARVEGQSHRLRSGSDYDTSKSFRLYWPKRVEEIPIVSVNPLGVAFGYVAFSCFLRRTG